MENRNFVDYCFETAKNVTYAQKQFCRCASGILHRREDIATSMDKLTQERQALMALAQHLEASQNSKKVQRLISRYLILQTSQEHVSAFNEESQQPTKKKKNFIVKILSNSVAHCLIITKQILHV